MKILIVSKILVVAAYRRKLDEIAARAGVDKLVAVTAPQWRESGGRTIMFEPPRGNPAYDLRIEPTRFNGNYHLFFWPRLGQVMRQIQPDLVHMDEEPYNVATAHGTWLARKVGARSVFFSWQNLLRRYPPPFSWFEQAVFRRSSYAIAGSAEALHVLRAKGYAGPGRVIPQFGVDPVLFSPAETPPAGPPVIGFVARLVQEKGILVLLDALAGLAGDWRLHVVGTGPLEAYARRRATALGLANRITWERGVASEHMPQRLRTFSVLVQPSLTRGHWKEQFGRAIMEAMACGVAVIGSASGEIPNVIGDAGVVVPEGDAGALCDALSRTLRDPERRAGLGRLGRERVLEFYTHNRVAEQTVGVYRAALSLAESPIGATIA